MNSLDAALQFALASQLQVSFFPVKHGGLPGPAWRDWFANVGRFIGQVVAAAARPVPTPSSPALYLLSLNCKCFAGEPQLPGSSVLFLLTRAWWRRRPWRCSWSF